MAERVWGGGSVMDGNWGTVTCWTGDTKPQAGDDVVFNATDATNCLMDEAPANLGSMDVQSTYGGDIDFNDQTFSCGDMTFDGTGIVSCGTGTITCSGNFDNKDQGTWTRETSTLKMTGTSKTLILSFIKILYALEIDGSITLDANTNARGIITGGLVVNNGKSFTLEDTLWVSAGSVTNAGTLTINAGGLAPFGGGGTISNTGTIDGTNEIRAVSQIINNSGTWSVANTIVRNNSTLNGGTYGGTWLCELNSSNATFTFGTGGSIIFTGDVTFDADAGGTYTIKADTNDVNLEFQNDVTISETGGGTLVWVKAATGTVLFSKSSGTQVYTDSTSAIQDLGNVVHDDGGGTGTLQLATQMECSKFDGDDGSFDPNEQTIDCGGNVDWDTGWDFIGDADALNGCTWEILGNFTADAQTCNATAEWFLQVDSGSTAVVLGVGSVQWCNANGVNKEIDATAGPWVDGDNNTNWNFGAAEAITTTSTSIILYQPETPSYEDGYAENAEQSANPGLWDGLVGAWVPALGNTGGKLYDVSGRGNDGVLTNMDQFSDWVGTEKGLALDFDGSDYVTLALQADRRIDNKITVATLIRARTLTNHDSVFVYLNIAFFQSGWGMSYYSGDLRFWVRHWDGQATAGVAKKAITAPTDWLWVVGSCDGSMVRIWIDNVKGTSDAYTDTTFYDGNEPDVYAIGRGFSNNRWDGQIGHIILWDRAITSSEVKQISKDPLAPFLLRSKFFRSSTSIAAAEEEATTPLSINRILNSSWLGGLIRSRIFPVVWPITIIPNQTLDNSWTQNVQQTNVQNIEWLQGVSSGSQNIPIEFLGGINQGNVLDASWLSFVSKSSQKNMAWLATVGLDSTILPEWTAEGIGPTTGVTVPAQFNVDWLANISKNSIFGVSFIRGTIDTEDENIEWTQSLAKNSVYDISFTKGVGEAAIPSLLSELDVDWLNLVKPDSELDVAWKASLGNLPSNIPLEFVGQVDNVLTQLPVDWTKVVQIGHIINISWQGPVVAGVSIDREIPVDWTQLFNKDNIINLGWQAVAGVTSIAGTWILDTRDTLWILDTRGRVWQVDTRGTNWTLNNR